MSFDPRVSDTTEPGRTSLDLNSPTIGPRIQVKECIGFDIVGSSVDMEKLLSSSRRNVNWVTEAQNGHGRDMLRYNALFAKDGTKLILGLGHNGK